MIPTFGIVFVCVCLCVKILSQEHPQILKKETTRKLKYIVLRGTELISQF